MKSLLLLAGLLIIGTNANAGFDKGNGGDICENKMRNITNDIEEWLIKDSHKGLKLPSGLSEENYKNGMLEAIQKTILSCSSEQLYVGKSEKTCKNFIDQTGETRAICNFERFIKTSTQEQYRLMHHELAGVAGFESNNGAENSVYTISDQISEFLKEEIVLKLGIKKDNLPKELGKKNISTLPSNTKVTLPINAVLPAYDDTVDLGSEFLYGLRQTAITDCSLKAEARDFNRKLDGILEITISKVQYIKADEYDHGIGQYQFLGTYQLNKKNVKMEMFCKTFNLPGPDNRNVTTIYQVHNFLQKRAGKLEFPEIVPFED